MGGKTLAPDWLVMAGGGQWQPLRKRGGQQPHLDWLRAAASARAGSLRRLRSLGTPKRYPPNTPRGPHPKPLRAPPKHPLDTHPNTSSAPLNTPRTSPTPSRAPSGPPQRLGVPKPSPGPSRIPPWLLQPPQRPLDCPPNASRTTTTPSQDSPEPSQVPPNHPAPPGNLSGTPRHLQHPSQSPSKPPKGP